MEHTQHITDTLHGLQQLRDCIDTAIRTITQSLSGEESVTEADIIDDIEAVNTAWDQFASLGLSPIGVSADEILRMLGLEIKSNRVPEQIRPSFGVIAGGRS